MVASRASARERVWVKEWEGSMWMCMVCVWVSE